eukprot:6449740-Alexandrium_andersonii.AAC.1
MGRCRRCRREGMPPRVAAVCAGGRGVRALIEGASPGGPLVGRPYGVTLIRPRARRKQHARP